MSSFMERLMGRKQKAAQSAKDRLKVVLVTDRAHLSPEDLKNMQHEILQVIQKYCRVSESDIELKYEQRDRDNFLVADIPLKPRVDGEKPGSVHLQTSLTPIIEEDTGLLRIEYDVDEFATRELDPPAKSDESASEVTQKHETLTDEDTHTRSS